MRLAVCLACCLALASPARAQVKRSAVAAVALDRQLDAAALRAAALLEKIVQQDARLEWVDTASKADPDPDVPARLAPLLAEARRALDHLDLKAARARAEEAAALAAKHPSTFKELCEAHALVAMALLAADDRTAPEELARLFALQPGYAFDPKRLSPSLTKRVEAARAKAARLAPVLLRLEASPAAQVTVDGVPRGTTPVELKVAPGAHYAAWSAPGHQTLQRRVIGGLGDPVRVELRPSDAGAGLLEALQQVRAGLARQQPGPAGAALARWAGADEVLLAGLQEAPRGAHVLLVRVTGDGRPIAFARLTLSSTSSVALEALAPAARQLIAAPWPAAEPEPSRPAEPPVAAAARGADGAVARAVEPPSPAGYYVAGGGAALLAGAGACWLLARSQAEQIRAGGLATAAEVVARHEREQRYRTAALGLAIAGGAGVAAGLVMRLTSGSTPERVAISGGPTPGGVLFAASARW